MTFTFTTVPKGFPGDLVVRICLPVQEMKEMQVQSQGREDPLEEEMATQPTPVFLPGEFRGQRSLAGYSLWDGKESDTTE